jgi:DNA polymerase-3 subunit delta'
VSDEIWPVIGHTWAVEHLDRAIRHERIRHAYLITGPSRIGKTTLARAFAAAINCKEPNAPCQQCRPCKLILKNAHPDVTVVEAEGSTLKIDQVRALQQTLALRPLEARYRVAILRRFDEANPAAANALLKTLEEPAPNVVLILTAESADVLLPTIVSRCQPLHLRPLSIEAVRTALESIGAPEEQARTLSQISGGRIGWAIQAYHEPATLEERDAALNLLEQALMGNRRKRFALVEDLPTEKPILLNILDVWQSYWRDVLLIASGSIAPITNYDRSDGTRDLAKIVGTEAAQNAIEATRRTCQQIGQNVNVRLALEVLMLDYPKV